MSEFVNRCGASARKHAGVGVLAIVLGFLSGSVEPFLQQLHADKQAAILAKQAQDQAAELAREQQAAFDAAEKRDADARDKLAAQAQQAVNFMFGQAQKQLDDFKNQQQIVDKAQWGAIANKKDK